ncbi:hypothetical protein [Streptomyces sp. NBC_01429]|uniref:hypothetical protein n=1 Tax=Streptomyces sp. NBC_01429 TaxID=2903862 RepID=UPI002E296B4F|nr:hypothetical protein [Streptomyces sp. NBC_01429]
MERAARNRDITVGCEEEREEGDEEHDEDEEDGGVEEEKREIREIREVRTPQGDGARTADASGAPPTR